MNSNHKDHWFSTWFDTPYYHILYQDRDYQEASSFMQLVTQRLQLPQGASIMDLACGRGRHSIYLNQLGYHVTGVDLSASSIAFAKAQLTKTIESPTALTPINIDTIDFEVHDMTVPYHTQFDAVFNLFTSFGYFDNQVDDLNTIKAIYSNLLPGGYAVIDFMNVPYVLAHLQLYNETSYDGITFKQSRKFENGYIYKDIKFTDNGQDYHFTERVKALQLDDFKSYFNSAGLKLQSVYGDYQLNEYDTVQSDRLIMIVQK